MPVVVGACLGSVQQREAWEQWPGIHVVLHQGISQHNIPLTQGRIRSAATPVNTSRSMLGSLASRRVAAAQLTFLSRSRPGTGAPCRPMIPCGFLGRRGRCSSDP